MKANTLINSVVTEEYREQAHVRAILEEESSWYHVHRDEDVPNDRPVVVYVRAIAVRLSD